MQSAGGPQIYEFTPGWYLLTTKNGEELRAKHHLEEQGYGTYLPSDNQGPLIAGYLFLEVIDTNCDYTSVKYTRGVRGFVSKKFSGEPVKATPDLIELIKRTTFERGESFGIGTLVRIIAGPFMGMEGRIESKMDNAVDVLIEFMHRPQLLKKLSLSLLETA